MRSRACKGHHWNERVRGSRSSEFSREVGKYFAAFGRVLRPWTPGPVGKYGGHGGPLGHRRPGHQRPPAAPLRPSKPASNHHRRCAASSRSARRPSTTAVAPFSSWLAQLAETGVRMLLAAVFVPAGLAVLAARSLQPISRADALHTRMSGPAALHIAMPVAAVHQSLAHDCRWQISALVSMATWILLRLSGSPGATAKSQIQEWAFAGVSRSPYKLVHLQSGLPCGRVFCTQPHGLAHESGRGGPAPGAQLLQQSLSKIV